MTKTLSSFAIITVLTAILMAASLFLAQKGYPFATLGIGRLEGLASSASFIPLAALYFFSAALILILPLRAAAFLLVTATDRLHFVCVALFATIVGCLLARAAFGMPKALWQLWDWQFVFVAAIVAVHLLLNEIRRNVLLRGLGLVIFVLAALACLYWSFRL
jgi:hypothetical protein